MEGLSQSIKVILLFVVSNFWMGLMVLLLYWKLKKLERKLNFTLDFLAKRLERTRRLVDRETETVDQETESVPKETETVPKETETVPKETVTPQQTQEEPLTCDQEQSSSERGDFVLQVENETESEEENSSAEYRSLSECSSLSDDSLFWRDLEELGAHRKLVSSDSDDEFETWV